MARKNGLGKGLEALFEDNSTSSLQGEEIIKISEIEPNKNQPRKDFDQSALEQLADSIREHGIIQPLVVREISTGGYQIVAGERRYRAARMVGLTEVPAVVREFSDKEVLEIALIENLQRDDLNPIEEALGYKELIDDYNLTQDEVAKSVGKSRPAVANMLRLLNLPDEVITLVRQKKLSSGHARALLALESDEKICELAGVVVKGELNVRETEKFVKKQNEAQKPTKPKPASDSFYREMQISLNKELGRKIKVEKAKKGGKLVIEFFDKDDLKRLAQALTE